VPDRCLHFLHGAQSAICTRRSARPNRRDAFGCSGAGLCLDRRVSPVEWNKLRMGPRTLGKTTAVSRCMGPWALGSGTPWLVFCGRPLALTPIVITVSPSLCEGIPERVLQKGVAFG
jgi:hypothetical protein